MDKQFICVCRFLYWHVSLIVVIEPYIVSCTFNQPISILWYKYQWNLQQNAYIFIREYAFENVVWKKAAILRRPQCVLKEVNERTRYLVVPPVAFFYTEMNRKSTRFREWKKDIICTKSGCYCLFMLQYDLCHVTGVPWYPLNILRFRLTMQGFEGIILTNVLLNAGKI